MADRSRHWRIHAYNLDRPLLDWAMHPDQVKLQAWAVDEEGIRWHDIASGVGHRPSWFKWSPPPDTWEIIPI